MADRRYTYQTDLKDYMSGKLSRLATVGSGVYSRLTAGQRLYNAQVIQGTASVNTMMGGIKRMAGAYIGITAGIQLGRNSLQKWDEQMKSDAQLKSALISTNFAAGKSFRELATQADQLQNKTLFGDEATQQAQAMMLTFKNVRGEVYDRTIPALLDLATAMKTDTKSAAIQLGKALNDPKTGLTMLGRSGITFSEQQKEIIYNLVETGKMAEAQGIILDEIYSQFGGSAEAAAKAGLGPWQQFMNKMGDYMEQLGPLFNKGLEKIMAFTGWVERNSKALKFWGTVVAGFIAGYYSWIALTKAWTIAMAAYRSIVFVQIGLTRGWAVAQRALNLTMAANPIGLVIAGVAALGTALYLLIGRLNKSKSVYESVMKTAQENSIRERMELDLLFNQLRKTNPESEARKKLIGQINDKYPDLLKNMKLEKGSLDDLETAYQKIIASIEQKAKMAAAQDMLEEVYKERFKLLNEGPLAWTKIWTTIVGSNSGTASALMAGDIGNKLRKLGVKESALKKILEAGNLFTGGLINDDDPLGVKTTNTLDNIAAGGSRPTTINISLGKFQDQIVIHANNVKEGASDMADMIIEELHRVLNSANYALNQ